jgi:hypothetical protein
MKHVASPSATAEQPHGHQALSAYIRARFDEFSRSQKDVAQYIVDHLDEAAFQTAEELARRASTSSSTVVRFSQALGFEGFPELQQAARDEYRRRPPGGVNGESHAAVTPLFSLDHTEFEAALAADHVNVEDTAHKLSRSDFEAAIDAIVSAEKVLIAGTDQMAFFASYLRHLLMLHDEARAPPQGADDGDHGRDPLRGCAACPHQALLLVEYARVRALPHGPAVAGPGARLWRLQP